MSWVRSVASQPSEDVFDENADEMDIAQKEWKNTMEKRVKEGYREGIEAGKEMTLQQGFNQGYKEAAEVMFSCGQLKGTVSALLSWYHHNGCDSSLLSEMSDLLNEVGKYEECLVKNLKYTLPKPHVGDLMDTIEDMGLGSESSVEEHCSRTTEGRTCENGAKFSGPCCRSDNGTDPFQRESCGRTKCRVAKVPTLTWLKEKTASLVGQLGLSPDTTEHIQLL